MFFYRSFSFKSTKKTENSPIAETNVNVSYDDDNVNFANIQ